MEQGKIHEEMMKNHVNGEHDDSKLNIETALLKGKQHRLYNYVYWCPYNLFHSNETEIWGI